jgi:hypothetical protein
MLWYILCVLVWVLNVLDGVFTVRALYSGGFHELNPLMAYVIDNLGADVFFFGFKVIFPAIAMSFAAYGVAVRAPKIKNVICFVFSVYFVLMLWHIYLITL